MSPADKFVKILISFIVIPSVIQPDKLQWQFKSKFALINL